MSYCKIGYFACVCCLILCGCRQQEQRDAAEESVRTKLRQLHESMNNGCVGITKISAIGGVINDWISSVSNASHRTGWAIELSDAILSVDLTNQPYTAFVHKWHWIRILTERRCDDFLPRICQCHMLDYEGARLFIEGGHGVLLQGSSEV